MLLITKQRERRAHTSEGLGLLAMAVLRKDAGNSVALLSLEVRNDRENGEFEKALA